MAQSRTNVWAALGACGQWSGAHAGQASELQGNPCPPKAVLPPALGGDLKAHSRQLGQLLGS